MLQEKQRLNLEDIENLLHGSDPTEGIRYIDVNTFSNEAKLFIRCKSDQKCKVLVETFRPFVWFKGFDFNIDFSWEYFAVHISDYNEVDQCILYNKEILHLNENLQIAGKSPDQSEIFLKKFISSIEDRKKLCYSKMKEYGVDIEEQITQTNEKKVIERLEVGFKYLVHINGTKDNNNYSNPFLAYTPNGTLKKINGSYSNLMDFFMEGGLDVWKRSGVFLDKDKIFDFWKKGTQYQKLLFFLGFPLKNLLFSFENVKDSSNDMLFEVDGENIEANCSQINFKELINLTQNIFNEKTTQSKLFEFYEKKIKNNDIDFLLKYEKDFAKLCSLNIDEVKLDQIIGDNYSFESKKGFKNLNNFYISNGINLFYGEDRHFFALSPLEQYMIQSGKRLFKGYEEYPELRIMTMDIETKAQEAFNHRNDAALFPHMGRIFKIGILCNDGLEVVLNAQNNREEKQIIEEFFKILMDNNPDLFLTYNGEGFDFPFIIKRYEILNNFLDEETTLAAIRKLTKEYYSKFEGVYISSKQTFFRRDGNLKVGGSNEQYTQTSVLGINVCDTMFAVKRASAINKSIPNFKLKDNIKFAKLAKKNRVYVEGFKIGAVENSPSNHYLNPETGDWFKYHKELIFEESGYVNNKVKKKGVSTFIYSDENTLYLWDEYYDGIFMESCDNTLKFDSNDIELFFDKMYSKFVDYDKICFKVKNYVGEWLKETDTVKFALLSKNLKEIRSNLTNKNKFYPEKDFSKYVETTGADIVKQYLLDDLWETAKLDEYYSQATFLISKWLPTSYQRAATMGGATVWKLLLSAYSYKYKLGIADFDEPKEFSGGLVAMISCGFHDKSFKGDFSSLYPAAFYVHVKTPEIDLFGVYKLFMYYGWSTRIKYKKLMNVHKDLDELELSKKYEVRQLPIKILINSFYGMMGAAGVTPFADLLVAQGITCVGRQYLRHLIKWFTGKGYCATIAHTDGVFFSILDVDLECSYVGVGANWLVTKGKEYKGIAAHVAEYNDVFMKGIMGLDIDDIVESVINFSKGNYIYLKTVYNKNDDKFVDKIEIVGGAIIKKTQSEYITEFVDKQVVELMKKKPIHFLNSYWEYISLIQDRKIDVKLIASKAKIKKTKSEYLQHIKGVNKNGQPLNRQVHMEMLIDSNIDFELGDIVYYVNTGKSEKNKDSLSVNTTFATASLSSFNLKDIDNLFKLKDRSKIKSFLISAYNEKLLIPNKMELDGDIHAILENIESWKNIKFKVRELKTIGFIIDFIKTEYLINCSIVDLNKSNSNVDYNYDLYIKKFNSAVHPLFIAFNQKVRDKAIIDSKEKKPFLLESDLKLINSLPFQDNNLVQTSYEEVMEITPEEWDYWNTIKTDPKDFQTENK